MIVVVVVTPWGPRKGRPSVRGILVYYQSPRRVTVLGVIMGSEKALQNACVDLSHRLVLKVLLALV